MMEVENVNQNKDSILIVDDDTNVHKNLSKILEQEGYDTDVAENGGEAIQKSRNKFYDLVLLDIKLPDMEGTQLLAKLNEIIPKRVKIMLTGYPNTENAIEALNQGADAYLTKPVKPAKLLALIKEKLEKQRQDENVTEGKVTDWIKTRARKLEEENMK